MQVIIHNVRSVHNVGSIFRTADAAGISKIYLTGYTPTPVDRFGRTVKALSKVSLGAEKTLDWEQRKNIARLITELKSSKNKIFALEQHPAAQNISKIKLSKKQGDQSTLIVGNEIRGLDQSTLKKADIILEIPMHGKKESLNVSVAFGIAVFWLTVLN